MIPKEVIELIDTREPTQITHLCKTLTQIGGQGRLSAGGKALLWAGARHQTRGMLALSS